MNIAIQTREPLMVVRFRNHEKAVAEPLETLKYVKQDSAAVQSTETYGIPLSLQVRKIFGARPVNARLYSERLPAKRKLLAALQADVSKTSLIT